MYMAHTFRSVSPRVLLSGLGLAAVLGVAACDDSTSPAAPAGYITIINANPSSSTATISLHRDSATFISGVTYGTGKTQRAIADTAIRDFAVVAGTDDTELATTSFVVKADSVYQLLFIQRTGGPALVSRTFPATAAPADGKAKLSVANYSTTPVDVYVTDSATALSEATAAATNLTFEQASAYVEYTAAAKRVRLTAVGDKATILLDKMVTLSAGDAATVLNLDAATAGGDNKALLLPDR
jgi:hypothetical protein